VVTNGYYDTNNGMNSLPVMTGGIEEGELVSYSEQILGEIKDLAPGIPT